LASGRSVPDSGSFGRIPTIFRNSATFPGIWPTQILTNMFEFLPLSQILAIVVEIR